MLCVYLLNTVVEQIMGSNKLRVEHYYLESLARSASSF